MPGNTFHWPTFLLSAILDSASGNTIDDADPAVVYVGPQWYALTNSATNFDGTLYLAVTPKLKATITFRGKAGLLFVD